MRQKINILFLLPSLKLAGAETQVIDLINGMDNDRFNKHIVIYENNLEQFDRLDTDNIRFQELRKKSFFDISLFRKIAAIIDQNKIDVMHCSLQHSIMVGWFSARMSVSKPKMIGALHTTKNVNLKNEIIDKYFYRWILKRFDRIIFVCQSQKEYWIKKYPELEDKSDVVYNGVDTIKYSADYQGGQEVTEIKGKYKLDSNYPVVSCVAGFRKEKGHKILIEAFKGIDEEAYLMLVGDGPLKKEIQNEVLKTHKADKVIFTGEIRDVRPILKVSDLMVLASTAVETFSMSMLEAMAMGVPVMASDTGGLSEAICNGENGQLIVPGDIMQLAQELKRLLSNPELMKKMGGHARETVVNRFGRHQMIERTSNIICEASI